jgi:hypothetical protein
MDPFHFTCPHCGAHLKTRDRLSVGRKVNCPECHRPFGIVQTPGGLATEKHEPPAPAAPPKPKRPAPSANRTLVVAVVVLGVVFTLLAGLTWRQYVSRSSPAPVAKKAPQPAPKVETKPAGIEKPVKVLPDSPERRLLTLGEAVARVSKADQTFPSGGQRAGDLGIDKWFGWLSTLLPHFEPEANIPVQHDRGWRDPLNDTYVRRRVPAFQNPAVKSLAGEDGYPAAHFAGVAGVGEDGPKLSVDDRRAGIFAYDRRTRHQDVRDGLAQTMLVAGVSDKLGSWASATATVRSFAREPYVNGPDGFGTGQTESMLVLMADGRVATLSVKTAPDVVRRMAALADEKQATPPAAPVARGPDDEPIEPFHSTEDTIPPELAVAPPPKRKSVEEIDAALQQAIASYTFPPKSALRVVALKEVAEMTGVPLQMDDAELGPAAHKLLEPLGTVPAPLTDTTVGKVLAALLDPVGLKIQVEPGQLRVVPNPVGQAVPQR